MPRLQKPTHPGPPYQGGRIRFRKVLGLSAGIPGAGLRAPALMQFRYLIQRIERGEALLTVPRLIKLAEAFGVDPAELLRDFSSWEAREGDPSLRDLTDEERRLLTAWHRFPDKVQRHNVLDLVERMHK